MLSPQKSKRVGPGRLSVGIALGACALSAQAVDLPTYDCRRLDDVGFNTGSIPARLNNLGAAVGRTAHNESLGLRWNKKGQLAAQYSAPGNAERTDLTGINDDGIVVGTGWEGYTGPDPKPEAVVWKAGQPAVLPTFPGGSAVANGINRSGQIVGTRYLDGSPAVATVWTTEVPAALPPLVEGQSANAIAINRRGDVAGTGATAVAGVSHAVRWRDGLAIDLGVLKGWDESWATGINDAGVIIGVSWNPGKVRATVWKGNKPRALPQPPHSDSSTPVGINRHGEIVGRAGSNGYEPMYWASVDAEPVEINQLIGRPCSSPEGRLVEITMVEAINDHGVVLGWGSWRPQGSPAPLIAAFKLVPIVGSNASTDDQR